MVELKKKLNIKSNNYLHVLEIINSKNHKARLVGGVVRDAILGIESEDIDIITTMLPEESDKKFFRAFRGIKYYQQVLNLVLFQYYIMGSYLK